MQTLVILLAILAVTCNGITRIIAQPSSDHASSVVHTTAVRDTAHPSRSLRVDRPERGTDRDSLILEHAIRERASRSRASDDYHHSRSAYKKEAQAARDRYYEDYFDRLREYAVTLQRQRYIAMLEKQAKERAKLDEELKSWQDGSVDPNDTPSETTTAPPNPFEHTAEVERSRAGHGARGPQRGPEPERPRAPQRHVDPLCILTTNMEKKKSVKEGEEGYQENSEIVKVGNPQYDAEIDVRGGLQTSHEYDLMRVKYSMFSQDFGNFGFE